MSQGSHFHIRLQGGVHQKFNNLQKLYHITIKWDQKLDTPWGFSNPYRSEFLYYLTVNLFIIQTIKEALKQKHKLELTQLLLKLSHPLSQLFKLVKLILSFEIVLRKVLFRLLCLKLMSLMIALKRLGTYLPVTRSFRENFLSESLCRTKRRFVKMNSD